MADTLLGNLIWRITGDTRDFDSKVKATDKSAVGLGSSLKKIGLGIAGAFAGYAIIDKTVGFLKDSAKAATEAGEVYSKFGVVFDDVNIRAKSAVEAYADAFDLADVSAQKLISNTGNILQGFGATADQSLQMSLQINTLAADLASFTNIEGGAERASQALTQALTGEREMAKALGIVIREDDIQARLAAKGKDKLTGSALNLAKAQVTLEIATEQSKNAIGDYARTQDSTANTLKRAKESTLELQVALGEALNPATTLAASLWDKVASSLADVIKRQNELKGARDAEKEGNQTIDQRIILMEREEKVLKANLNAYKAYDSEGKLIRSQALVDAEKELASLQARKKGLEIQRDEMRRSTAQQQEARTAVDAYTKAQKDAKKADDDAYEEKLKEIEAMIQAHTDELEIIEWKTKKEIIGAEEASAAVYAADVKLAEGLRMVDADAGVFGRDIKKTYDDLIIGINNYNAKLKDKTAAEEFQKNLQTAFGAASSLVSALGDLVGNLYQRRIDQLDLQMQKEMEAAGVAESTAVQQAELELAKAKETGDAETILEAEKALKKAQIQEAYDKKKAELEYKAAMASWRLNLLSAQVSAAQSVVNAYRDYPWPANIAISAIMAGLATVQTAAIMAAKPVRTYAEGGSFTVPEGYNGDSFPMTLGMAQSGERVTIETPQQQAENDRPVSIVVPVNLDGKEVARVVTKYQRNRLV